MLISRGEPAHHTALETPDTFRRLVDGIEDFAIYMLDGGAGSLPGTQGPSASRDIGRRRSSDDRTPRSFRPKRWRPDDCSLKIIARNATAMTQKADGKLPACAFQKCRTQHLARCSGC